MANKKLYKLIESVEMYVSEDRDPDLGLLDHDFGTLVFYASSKEEAEKVYMHYIANKIINSGLFSENDYESIIDRSDNYEQFCDEIVKKYGYTVDYYEPESDTFNRSYYRIEEVQAEEAKDLISGWDKDIEHSFNCRKSENEINIEDI